MISSCGSPASGSSLAGEADPDSLPKRPDGQAEAETDEPASESASTDEDQADRSAPAR